MESYQKLVQMKTEQYNIVSKLSDQNYRKAVVLIIASLAHLFVLCGNSDQKRPIDEIKEYGLGLEVKEGDSVVLCWDPPQYDLDTVAYYELYYYTDGNDSGLIRTRIPPAAKPEIVVYRRDLPSTNTVLYFGIRYITGEGIVSNFNYSTDSTLNPSGGWRMVWEK